MALKVFILEDQVLFREMIVGALRARLGVEVFGEYSEVDLALEQLDRLCLTNVGLVDVRLGRQYSFELVDALIRRADGPRLIWVTSVTEDYLFHRAYSTRLPGFVHKEDSLSEMMEAVSVVAAGRSYYSDRVRRIYREMKTDPMHFSLILSHREQQVLQLLGQGLSNEETAAAIGLSPGTVQAHRRNIMCRLNLHSAADLVAYAVRRGFTDPSALQST